MSDAPPPVTIGVIPKDTLIYHGAYPFSDWGSIWKKVYSKLPPDAAYGIYDQCIRATNVIPVPPLQFINGWENKNFRIMKTEGQHVVALYRHDGDFYLIQAVRETYESWAQKKQRDPNHPPFSELD